MNINLNTGKILYNDGVTDVFSLGGDTASLSLNANQSTSFLDNYTQTILDGRYLAQAGGMLLGPLIINTGTKIGLGVIGNGNITLTVGGAGSGAALPANPDGYLLFSVNGIIKKIPFYQS